MAFSKMLAKPEKRLTIFCLFVAFLAFLHIPTKCIQWPERSDNFLNFGTPYFPVPADIFALNMKVQSYLDDDDDDEELRMKRNVCHQCIEMYLHNYCQIIT